jgi:hypothetical protein
MSRALSIIGSANKSTRPEHDFYPTPPQATEALLRMECFNGSILEPACGDGAISKILVREFKKQHIVSCDLIDRGYGRSGSYDFLKCKERFDNIITNPPYKYATEFVKTALDCSNNKIAMLLKLQFLETVKRHELFKSSPLKIVYVFSKRLSLYRNGEQMKNSGMLCFAWFVWDKNFNGKPTVDWIL